MYCEDADLSLRLRLAGGTIGIEPARARRPRLRVREGSGQVAAARAKPLGARSCARSRRRCWCSSRPRWLATELALWAVAIMGGWGRQKLLATVDVIRSLPRLMRERRAIQAARRIGASEFAAASHRRSSRSVLSRPLARNSLVRSALRAYWMVVRALLRVARVNALLGDVRRLGRLDFARSGGDLVALRRRGEVVHLLVEPRDLLGEHLVLLGEPRDREREVQQQHQDEPERDDEQRVRRVEDADRVRRSSSSRPVQTARPSRTSELNSHSSA